MCGLPLLWNMRIIPSVRQVVEMLAGRCGVKLPKMEYSKEAKAQADLKAAPLEIITGGQLLLLSAETAAGWAGYDYLQSAPADG